MSDQITQAGDLTLISRAFYQFSKESLKRNTGANSTFQGNTALLMEVLQIYVP